MSTFSVKTNKSYAKNIFRKVVPLAATIAVVFMSMIAAQAAGVDIFGSLARWTEETFHFNGGDSTPAADGTRPQVEDDTYLAIQAEVDKLGIDIPVVPTWFPDGYELQEINSSDPGAKEWPYVDCLLKNEDSKTIVWSVTKYEEGHDIMVYHARTETKIEGNPLYNPNRHAMLMKLEWKDGRPVFRF